MTRNLPGGALPVPCDVLVVGGGAAGVAAAIGAGRQGARVVLIERYGFLGGMAAAAQVGTVCGLYLRDAQSERPEMVAGGFLREFATRLQEYGGAAPMRLESGLWVLPVRPLTFERVADHLTGELGKITLALHTTAADARLDGSVLVEVQALAWNQPLTVRPSTVVDCTGEATVAALIGLDLEEGMYDQAPALVFTLENVEPGLIQRGLLEMRREIRRGIKAGQLSPACERLALVPGANSEGRLILKLNLSQGEAGCPAWQQVTAWERQARMWIEELHRFLVLNVTSCRQARLAAIAPQLGIRSGRRIRARATLGEVDILGARKLDQGIARGSWPMERWGAGLQPEMSFFAERDFYEISLDCLRSRAVDNLFVAGRCLGATGPAMTSARVIGTALGTGWAAGVAAACQAAGGSPCEAIGRIREQMNR